MTNPFAPTPIPMADDPHLARLRDRLAGAAARERLVDVAYRTVDTPLGSLLLAVTDHGLARVAFECEGHDATLEHLAATVSPRVMLVPRRLDGIVAQIDEYFDGRRMQFDVELDLRLSRGFRLTVLQCLRAVPYGSTATYAEVAVAAGNPRAVRAVGTACGHNPVPVVVPCHRIVRSDGSIGQYLGGREAKEALLALEERSA